MSDNISTSIFCTVTLRVFEARCPAPRGSAVLPPGRARSSLCWGAPCGRVLLSVSPGHQRRHGSPRRQGRMRGRGGPPLPTLTAQGTRLPSRTGSSGHGASCSRAWMLSQGRSPLAADTRLHQLMTQPHLSATRTSMSDQCWKTNQVPVKQTNKNNNKNIA